MEKIFFDNWQSIVRTAVITIMSYTALIVLLRGIGKRTLSKMNAFDFIITVALGSTLSSVMLTKDVALADGVLAFFLLIGLQFIITWLSVRNKHFSHLVKSKPSLLAYRGALMHPAMKKERIAVDEIFAVLREKGPASLAEADAIVLETDGSLSVLARLTDISQSSLQGVENLENKSTDAPEI